MPYHRITLQDAATLVQSFLNHNDIGSVGTDQAIGGLIDLTLPENELANGCCFWNCWNQEDNNYPSFFISYEPNVYDSQNPGNTTTGEILRRPYGTYVFTYPD